MMLSFSVQVKLYNMGFPQKAGRGVHIEKCPILTLVTFDVFGILCLVEHVTDVETDYCCLIPKCSFHSKIEENRWFTFS